MVQLIGVRFDLCGRGPGSRLGPSALQLAGLVDELEGLGIGVCEVEPLGFGDGRMPPLSVWDSYSLQVYRHTAERVGSAYADGHLPMVLGGDHSVAIGSIGGALRVHGDELAVLWLDAHMDLNTPATSPTGNLHGMALAALLGLPGSSPRWQEIAAVVGPTKLRPERVGWLGLRDVDAGERAGFTALQVARAWTMQDLDERGVATAVDEVGAWLSTVGARKLWISFDVDLLDPHYAPGTGTAVRGGLTYREGHLLAERLFGVLGGEVELVGLDVVEVNPLQDQKNETARTAVEWVASLFGKRILG